MLKENQIVKGLSILILCIAFGFVANVNAFSATSHFADMAQAKREMKEALKGKHYTEGLELAQRAVRQFPASGEIGNYEAFFLQVLGRYEEAKAAFLRVGSEAKEKEQRSYAFCRLSAISNTDGDREKALEYALKADSVHPLASTKAALGDLWYTSGNYNKSLTYFKEALNLIPSMNYRDEVLNYRMRRGFEYSIALCLYRSGKQTEARQIIQKLKEEAAQRNDPFYCVAYYALSKRPELAVRDLDSRLSRVGNNRRKAILDNVFRDIDGEYAFLRDSKIWNDALEKWKREIN